MEFPTLKFPIPHGKLEARMKYELGLLDPDGFAATYFEALKSAEEEMDLGYLYETNDYQYHVEAKNRARASLEMINREQKKVREKIDRKMQEYLLSHDGQIDFWPDGSGFHFQSSEWNKYYFHYFGAPYDHDDEYDEYNYDVHRRSSELVYHNEYHTLLEPASEPHEADEKKERLRKDAELQKEILKDKRFTCIVCMVIGAFLLFAILSLLANWLFGTGGPVVSLVRSINDSFAGNYAGTRTFFLLLSLAGAWGCITRYLIYRDSKVWQKESAQAYQEYLDGLYEQDLNAEIERENRKAEARKKDLALSREWHTAWFEWAKQVGDAPKD